MVGAGAAVSVAAGADFEVEGAVYFVFFRSVDSGESLCHFGCVIGMGWFVVLFIGLGSLGGWVPILLTVVMVVVGLVGR